ncbi:thermitase Serine peptidase. MEROPS family S08A [Paenibacillaceae bacterium GAS479]|nr:thermitase Serine peptidase. MEROPS family S08A [Paenibacillaceae bacterium GAS479]
MMDLHWLPVMLLSGAVGAWWLAGWAKGWMAERRMPEHEPGELIVKFQEGLRSAAKYRIHSECGCLVSEEQNGTGLHIIRAKRGGVSSLKLRDRYHEYPEVEYAEPNYRYRNCLMQDDSYYGLQYGAELIKAEQAWNVTVGKENVIIAVLDTGIDSTHPDLAGKVLAGKDYINPAGSADDPNGHGTHVAGIAAARTNKAAGITGIAPGVSLLPVRVLDAEGNGTLLNIAAGIRYAADMGAHVINLSLGGPARSWALRSAIRYAVSKGAVVVAAAGNTGSLAPVYPGAYDEVIAVGSVGPKDIPSTFSAYGMWVDLAAPGEQIVSTYTDSRYTYFSGTSMAAPHVSGVAALLASLGLSESEIRRSLLETADPSGDAGSHWLHGRVDAGKAVSHGDS